MPLSEYGSIKEYDLSGWFVEDPNLKSMAERCFAGMEKAAKEINERVLEKNAPSD